MSKTPNVLIFKAFFMSHCCNSVFSRHKWSKFLTNCCPGFFPLTWLRCKWPQHIINKKTVAGPTSCVIKSTCCTICDARECLHVCSPYVRWYPHILSLSVYLLSHKHSHTRECVVWLHIELFLYLLMKTSEGLHPAAGFIEPPGAILGRPSVAVCFWF